MNKFTIEDLRDIAYRGSYDDLERELALQLLASMEQAPVYLRPFGDDGETFVACDGDDERAITLYAAPQLPQPAVLSVSEGVLKSLLPDVEKSEFWFEHNGKIFFEGVRFNNAVFEACRAAMLNGGKS